VFVTQKTVSQPQLLQLSMGVGRIFSRGGQKRWNLFCTSRNWKNNLFLLIISKSRGPRPPLFPFRCPCSWVKNAFAGWPPVLWDEC